MLDSITEIDAETSFHVDVTYQQQPCGVMEVNIVMELSIASYFSFFASIEIMFDHFICILYLYLRSLAIARPDEVQELAAPVTTYTVLEKGTESQGRLLVQRLGYSYTVKHTFKQIQNGMALHNSKQETRMQSLCQADK